MASGTPPIQHTLFPHAQMRSGQLDFYNDARAAAHEGKILLANAPTGIGKTAASLSGALESALMAGRKVVFLTHRNSHHIQAMIESRAINEKRKAELSVLRPECPSLRIIDKISKHRMCLLRAQDPSDDSPYLRCEIANCRHSRPKPSVPISLLENPISASESVQRSLLEEYCAHYAALAAVRDADIIVCDYSYLFDAQIQGMFRTRLGRALQDCDVIIDEAHNLPDRIMDINAREMDEKTLKNASRALSEARKLAADSPEMLAQISLLHSYLKNTLSPSVKLLVGESGAAKEEKRLTRQQLSLFLPATFAQQILENPLFDGETLSTLLYDTIDFLRAESSKPGEGGRMDIDGLASLAELAEFLNSSEKAASGDPAYGAFLRSSEDRMLFRIRIALFDPSIISQQIFSDVHSAVLMSGTLIGKKGLCDLLGIDGARTLGIEEGAYLSPFDAKRQRVRICNWVSSRQRERTDASRLKVMAAIIDEAARACAPHSLAIFYPSYEYLRMVKDNLVLSGFRHETEMRGERHPLVEERKIRIESRTFEDKPIAFHGVVGGSYSEGMDFRNNPFKLIIIAGFPFPKPDARHDAYEGYLKGKFKSDSRAQELASILPAAIKSVQAIGRGIRKGEEYCYCLLIDDRFANYIDYFQPSFRGKIELLAATEKKKIWEDIYAFMAQMDAAKEG
ncbi:ATP-dependent DNA helicase [uncultured archaeon]|nr:ATP-dependent DNA helicase [uncultured archaeon]